MGSRLRSLSKVAARRVLSSKVNVQPKRLIRELLGEWVRGRPGDGERRRGGDWGMGRFGEWETGRDGETGRREMFTEIK
jgi:hypothetical protein